MIHDSDTSAVHKVSDHLEAASRVVSGWSLSSCTLYTDYIYQLEARSISYIDIGYSST